MKPRSPPRRLAIAANVAGLSGGKLLSILIYMQERAAHLGIFSETKTKESPENLLARTPGAAAVIGSWIFHHTPGTGLTAGITIVIAAASEFAAFQRWEGHGDEGRVIRLDGPLDGKLTSIIGVYGPSPPSGREPFLRLVSDHLPRDGRPLLCAGDWNITLSDSDIVRPGGTQVTDPGSRAIGRMGLQKLMTEVGLVDVWRDQAGPAAREYTHWSESAGSGARLDFWLVSPALLPAARSRIEGPVPVKLDHAPVSLTLRGSEPPLRLKGLDSFPLLVFGVQAALDELKLVVASEAEALMGGSEEGLVQRWNDSKERMRKEAHRVYAKHRKERLREAQEQEEEARAAAQKLGQPPAASAATAAQLLQEWRAATAASEAAWGKVLRPVKEAAAMADHEAGEASTYFFHSRVQVKPAPTHIQELNRPGREASAPPQPASTLNAIGLGEALQYATDFFSSASPFGLFKEHDGITKEAQTTLLGSLSRHLSGRHAELAEGPDGDSLITKEEVRLAIESANRGSAPGWDGLPYEFYRVFAAELIPVLVRVFNSAFNSVTENEPLAELLTGVICLILKPGQAKEELVGYRPITLLNTDVKLIMFILSGRLQLPLDYLIDIGQSAFLRGRDISDNVRYHKHLVARLVELGIPGWLLLADMSKAYDSVSRPWLRSTMVTMGFREGGAARWCRLLLQGSSCRVRVNGAFSGAFPVSSGLFQGSSLSCQEWVIALQPLVSYLGKLQAQGKIAPLALPSQEQAPVVLAHADDTKFKTLRPDQDGPAIKEAFALARAAGLPGLSAPKTVLMPLSPGPDPPGSISLAMGADGVLRHLPTGFRALEHGHQPHRLLGVPLSIDAAACTEQAFAGLEPKVRAKIQQWLPQKLTIWGKGSAANQSLASKMVYQTNFCSPGDRVRPVQLAISRFLSTASTPEEEQPYESQPFLSQTILSLAPGCGGVGAPTLELAAESMLAKPVWRSFCFLSHPWAELFKHEVSGALAPPPDAPAGMHCLVTRPMVQPAFPGHATDSAKHAALAFQSLGVQRIMKPEEQDHWSVMHELTFEEAGAAGGRQQAALATPAARSWLRLREVRAAWQGRDLLSDAERADLASLLAALPARWRAEVQRDDSPQPDWVCVSPADRHMPAVFRGPDLGTAPAGSEQMWELWPSGVLRPLSFPMAPGPPGLLAPALVVWQPKPRASWSRREMQAAGGQAALPADQRVGVREPRLVGVWEDLGLDPRVWGVPECPGNMPRSLLDMAAGRARRALAHLQLSSAAPGDRTFVLGYKQERAAFPAAWRRDQLGHGPPPVQGASLDALPRFGLLGQEEKWRRSAEALSLLQAAGGAEASCSRPPPIYVGDPSARPPPRPSPEERAAARADAAAADAAAADIPLRGGYAAAWGRLTDPTISRAYRGTVWRVMHGVLGCGGYLAHCRYREAGHSHLSAAGLAMALGRGRCKAPCCSQLSPAPLETVSHALLHCPAVEPAVTWLRGIWAALAKIDVHMVPVEVDVLLADDLSGWPSSPAGFRAQRLWTRLRVATLGAIWQARCERDEGGIKEGMTLARRAATLALRSVQSAILRDWARAGAAAPHDLPGYCAAWLRGFDASITLAAFKSQWAVPGFFCSVTEQPGQPPELEVHIGGPLCPALPA